MNRLAIGFILSVTIGGIQSARAQAPSQIAGTWSVLPASADHDANIHDILAERPCGMMTFAPGGPAVHTTVANGFGKTTARSRDAGDKAILPGGIASFGTCMAEGGVVDLHVQASAFPSMTAPDQKRTASFNASSLTWGNPVHAGGSGLASQPWRRVR